MDVGDDPLIQGIYRKYENALKANRFLWPPPKDANKKFYGVNKCAECHRESYKIWKTTRHAKALQTLVNEGQEYNPACLKCHVTGFERDNGFWDYPSSAKTRGDVQCEECHGGGDYHIKKVESLGGFGGKKLSEKERRSLGMGEIGLNFCKRCHDKKMSPKFDADHSWRKIKH